MTNIHVLPQSLPVEIEQPLEAEKVLAPTSEVGTEPLRFPVAAPEPEPVGAALEEIRADLMRHGDRLAGLLADPGATFVRDALRVLENQVCRIAVIGQVKGGQSAFVGAFVEQPDVLPQHISPWSTAVTRLHFGVASAPEGIAAEVQLFEGVEWQRLAAGPGRVRELTTQLVPGFEPDLLGRHLDAMQQRAEQRFGGTFQELLGAKHAHATVSLDVLARYLGPGSSGATVGEGPGQFADITRTVDLYCKGGPFRFPVSVIVMPGINDPFLVRDEITRHHIEAADIYVMVLSARQPLSSTDLAVLRILRGLHKERLVVFIDHIDELRDTVGETRDIIARVRQTLAREFPATEIPVVVGSARWANQALAADTLDVRQVLTPGLLAYAKQKGAMRPVEVKGQPHGAASEDLSGSQLARALSVCSGYPELHRTLTGVLQQSHSAHLVRQIAAYFAELAQINEGTVREDMAKHAASTESDTQVNAESERELQHVQGELARIQAVASELERKLAGLQNLMGEVVAAQRSHLYRELASILDGFARREGDSLVLAFADGRARRNWRCDCTQLRTLVAAEVARADEIAEARLAASEFNVFPALRESMLRLYPDAALPEVPALCSDIVQAATPVATPIGDTITIDLGASGPLVGWARSKLPVEHAGELERLLVQELMPAIDEVTRLATSELQRRVSVMSERSTAISVAVIEALRKRSEGFINRAKELLDARESRPAEEMAQAERLNAMRERLAVAEALSRRLSDLNARCEETVG